MGVLLHVQDFFPPPSHSRRPAPLPPLLVLHGLFGSGKNWATLARAWAGQRRVLTVDARNHGQSPWTAALTYPEMAADIVTTMDHYDIEICDLLGHSMGGKTAMVLALTVPERIRRLVVMDMAPVAYRHDHQRLLAAMAALPLETLHRRREAEAALAAQVGESFLAAFLAQNLVFENGIFRWQINIRAIQQSLPDLLGFPALAGQVAPHPALFLGAGRADYLRPEDCPAVVARFSAATLTWLATAGHWLHAQYPQTVIRLVEDFCTARERGETA